MNGPYERLYRKHFGSIAQSHPQTASNLRSIKRQFGTHAAYHAASLIICLETRMEISGVEAVGFLSEEDLEEFTYFRTMRSNVPALELLVEILECHVLECLSPCKQLQSIEQRDLVSALD